MGALVTASSVAGKFFFAQAPTARVLVKLTPPPITAHDGCELGQVHDALGAGFGDQPEADRLVDLYQDAAGDLFDSADGGLRTDLDARLRQSLGRRGSECA